VGFPVYISDSKQLFYGLDIKGHDQKLVGKSDSQLGLSIVLGPFSLFLFSLIRWDNDKSQFPLLLVRMTSPSTTTNSFIFYYCSWKQMDSDWLKKKLMIYQYSLNYLKTLPVYISQYILFNSLLGLYPLVSFSTSRDSDFEIVISLSLHFHWFRCPYSQLLQMIQCSFTVVENWWAPNWRILKSMTYQCFQTTLNTLSVSVYL
jgi:hypothetical protein